ncbi:MAG: hypothetical protein AAF517_12610, partial [Planctomycetota bacterium]
MRATLCLAVLFVSTASMTGSLSAQPMKDQAFLGITTESIVEGDPKSGLRVTYVFPNGAAEG